MAGPAPTREALARDTARDLSVAAALLLAAGLALAHLAPFSAAYAAKAMTVYALGAALIWRALRDPPRHPHPHPHRRFGAANRLTLLRFALCALLAGLLGEANARGDALAWVLMVMATVTAVLDAADGVLARRSGLASEFGARFDMETDAWLTLVLCLLLLHLDKLGAWVLAAGLMRYAFVAAARIWPWLAAPLPPSRRRQAVCVAQITTLIVCLGPMVPRALATPLAAASLMALTLSFALDLRYLSHTRKPRQTAPFT
jgi:phosphatidylglycerophosphate synthase